MKNIKRDKNDTDEEIQGTARYNSVGLASLQQESNFGVVLGFVGQFRSKFETLDGEWTLLIIGNDFEMSRWRDRKSQVEGVLGVLERNSAAVGLPGFNWQEVIGAMAWLLALFEASQRTLELNQLNGEQG